MKKLILLVPILLWSCNKTETVGETTSKTDPLSEKTVVEDTLKEIQTEIPAGRQGMLRKVEGNKIIRTSDAQQIPFNIGEEFTEDDQQFIVKIKNFRQKTISGEVTPENAEMNIRFNQIKLPDGTFDGPFGRQISYTAKNDGELWLIIGKSNMASGETKGKFSVSIK